MKLDFATSCHAPLWRSAFRPFYLLGTAYAVLVMVVASAGYLGLVNAIFAHPLQWWHGHEMAFGFATAMIVGTLLTGFVLYRMGRRKALPVDQQGDFVALPRMSPMAVKLHPEAKVAAKEEPTPPAD